MTGKSVFKIRHVVGLRLRLSDPRTTTPKLDGESGLPLPKMSAAKDGRRQAHMDVLVAVPGKGRLPHSTRQLSRLEGPEPLNQSIILLNSANSDSQKFANSGLIEVPDDNTLLPQAFGQNLARLIFMTGKDEVCLGG